MPPKIKPTAVTILMPVYNGETHITEAVNSILSQTFEDFMLLILNDGSTDKTASIISSFRDPRINIINNPRNLGLARTLNIGIKNTNSPFIARMDSDDISHRTRLQKQVDYLNYHHDVGLCGSHYCAFYESGKEIVVKPPESHHDILYALIFDNAFGHSTVMFRTEWLKQFRLAYNTNIRYAQDYELWVRMAANFRLANIPEVLVRYRIHAKNISTEHRSEQKTAAEIISQLHRNQIGMSPLAHDTEIHNMLVAMNFPADADKLKDAGDWLSRLFYTAVFRCRQHPVSKLLEYNKWWYSACGRNANLGIATFLIYLSKPYGLLGHPKYTIKLLWRCVTKSAISATN